MKAIVKNPPNTEAIARLSTDPLYNATMRTTCVATRLDAGHANNALPANSASHRELPDPARTHAGRSPPQSHQDSGRSGYRGPLCLGCGRDFSIRFRSATTRRRSLLRPEVMKPLEKIAQSHVAGRPGHPYHGHRRFRWRFHQRRGHTNLRCLRNRHRVRRCPRARPRRTRRNQLRTTTPSISTIATSKR